jgi:hypothetical protein
VAALRLARNGRLYERYASSAPGSLARVQAALAGAPLAPTTVREQTLELERQLIELFYGYCVKERGLDSNALGLALLTDLELVHSYLEWRVNRYKGAGVPPCYSIGIRFYRPSEKSSTEGISAPLGLG